MTVKYHIHTENVPSRLIPIAKLNAIEIEGCLGCRKCVKRDSCVFDVYQDRKFDPSQLKDSGDSICIYCFRCVQECKKNILSRTINPEFAQMGDKHWKPEFIASIWKQADTGKVPVSGAGYRGPFTGTGFDRIWTDMSEIVRPTRDGIHGREYISTVIELGRKPFVLEFDKSGNLITEMPTFCEIPIPMVLEIPERKFVTKQIKETIISAAAKTLTFAIVKMDDIYGIKDELKSHIIAKFNPEKDDPSSLKGIPIVEFPFSETVHVEIENVKDLYPDIITSIRIPVDENVIDRSVFLVEKGAEILHYQVADNGYGFGKKQNVFITRIIQDIHFKLQEISARDTVTVLFSGGIAMAEHIAKSVACGTDGVGLDLALLAALECRLCQDCDKLSECPIKIDEIATDWAEQRIVNLIAAWHSQLIELMGAMGLREVRRLRGELGRIMFFEDMEKENFAPIFGKRIRSLADSLDDDKITFEGTNECSLRNTVFPPLKDKVVECSSRYRNTLGKYKVIRTSKCINCGKCAELCKYNVHIKAGNTMLAPKSHFCVGLDKCSTKGKSCVYNCPEKALIIGDEPMWGAFGDPRWTSELLSSTWYQAETGKPPVGDFQYKNGKSGGGFDKINIVFPKNPLNTNFKPEDVDLSIPLNRRTDDNRPDVTIGVPFYGGGMSYGSISLTTMLARAKAYKAINSFTNTGEGGFPEELYQYGNNVITQIATGLFGIKEETIQKVRIVEFKYAQGAKPGLGGHLLGDKNTPEVSKMRETVPGVPLFSPFPFHSVYSIEDHKKHVDWIKVINTKTLVSVKVAGACDIDMVAVGSFFAGAHIVHLDGSYGGTGASPDIAKKNIAMPIEYAVPKVHKFLTEEGIREEITLIASGGIRSAWDIARIIALGADGVVLGTAEVVALECIRCGVCESGRGCPRGIATTDPELSKELDGDWAAQRLVNLFNSLAIQLQNICWRLGMKSIRELVGRSDLLTHMDYDHE